MIKPEVKFMGDRVVQKELRDLEVGEWFIHPEIGTLCIVIQRTVAIKEDDSIEARKIEFYSCERDCVDVSSGRSLSRTTTLAQVNIKYWRLKEEDVDQG